MASHGAHVIAYLAPELPALSATFVYEELLGLERRGFRVVPFSVRRPASLVADQKALAERTIHLYGQSPLSVALSGLAKLPTFGRRTVVALKQLLADMRACGPMRVESWKLAYQFLTAASLARRLLSEKCKHLHVHFAHTPTQIAMYASTLSGIPFTITAHANDIFERGLLLRQKAERAVRLLTISDYNRRYLEGVGVPRERLAVVRCGVSFEAASSAVGHAGIGSLCIGTLGRMVEKKGFDVLLRAVALRRQAGQPVELRIAGDGPLKPELQQLAQTLGIADITRFEGSLPHHEVAQWMHRLDLFVLACKKDKHGDMDGIPVVLMEAMSQSIPVISTRISGIPELVVHEETGLLSEPDDPADLAHQISRLADSTELRERLTTAAREHVAFEFGQSHNLDRLIEQFSLSPAPHSHRSTLAAPL
jgi:glycosyltransferase involved in cell wall biosynthesis